MLFNFLLIKKVALIIFYYLKPSLKNVNKRDWDENSYIPRDETGPCQKSGLKSRPVSDYGLLCFVTISCEITLNIVCISRVFCLWTGYTYGRSSLHCRKMVMYTKEFICSSKFGSRLIARTATPSPNTPNNLEDPININLKTLGNNFYWYTTVPSVMTQILCPVPKVSRTPFSGSHSFYAISWFFDFCNLQLCINMLSLSKSLIIKFIV